MDAISSYRGNRHRPPARHKHKSTQTGPITVHSAAKLSAQCNNAVSVWCFLSQLEVIEGSWPSDRGVAILSFQSLRDAELWKDSVPEIRQHDWLDGVDFVIVPITTTPRQ